MTWVCLLHHHQGSTVLDIYHCLFPLPAAVRCWPAWPTCSFVALKCTVVRCEDGWDSENIAIKPISGDATGGHPYLVRGAEIRCQASDLSWNFKSLEGLTMLRRWPMSSTEVMEDIHGTFAQRLKFHARLHSVTPFNLRWLVAADLCFYFSTNFAGN
jgi:hypothetical protein